MTSPTLPSLPHLQLGNVATDLSGAASNFAQGLIDERKRRQQLAMQQALSQANIAHLGAETDYLQAQKSRIPSEIQQNLTQGRNVGAEADTRTHENESAGQDQLLRLRNIHGYEKVPDNYFQGASRKDADDYINRAMQEAGMMEAAGMRITASQDKPMRAYDAQGNLVLVYPNPTAPDQPRVVQVPGGAGQAASDAAKHRASMGIAARMSDSDLTTIENGPNGWATMQEVARALQGPALARLLPFVGHDVEEAISQLRTLGLSPEATAYVKRLYDHASLVAPDRYGRQFRNPAILHQAWMDFGAGQITTSERQFRANLAATQRNRRNGVEALIGAAGPRATSVVQPAFGADTTNITGGTNIRIPPARLQP